MTMKLPWLFPGIRRPNFNLHQINFRVPTSIPPSIIYVLVFGIIFYIYCGGAYAIVNRDSIASIGSSGSRPVFINPSTQSQFLIEGIVAGFIIGFAVLSLFLLDYATKFAFDVNTAQKIEFLATFLTILWTIILLLIYSAKLP